MFGFTFQQFIIYLQEYISSKQANQVRSLMYMIDMLMTETLSKEDANENKHIKNYSMVNLLLFYFFLSEKGYLSFGDTWKPPQINSIQNFQGEWNASFKWQYPCIL